MNELYGKDNPKPIQPQQKQNSTPKEWKVYYTRRCRFVRKHYG